MKKEKKQEETKMAVLEHLQPERVFYYFEEISKIPRGSGNTKEISDYLVGMVKAKAASAST